MCLLVPDLIKSRELLDRYFSIFAGPETHQTLPTTWLLLTPLPPSAKSLTFFGILVENLSLDFNQKVSRSKDPWPSRSTAFQVGESSGPKSKGPSFEAGRGWRLRPSFSGGGGDGAPFPQKGASASVFCLWFPGKKRRTKRKKRVTSSKSDTPKTCDPGSMLGTHSHI